MTERYPVMRRLEGKVALVTGGAGGIGVATGRRLVDEGAVVVLADINLARAEAAALAIGDRASALEYDAADPASVERMVASTVERHGRLHILDTNAPGTAPQMPRAAPHADRDT